MAFQPATGDLADAIQARFMGGTSGSPTGGPYAVGDYKVDPVNKEIWVCTAAGSPGTWVASGGGGAGGLVLGTSVSLHASGNGAVTAPAGTEIGAVGAVTVGVWAKIFAGPNANCCILGCGGQTAGTGYQFSLPGGGLQLEINSQVGKTPQIQNDTDWHLFILVVSGGTNYLYVDGLLAASAASATIVAASNQPKLGGPSDSTAFAYSEMAAAHWFVINGVAITAAQIASLYEARFGGLAAYEAAVVALAPTFYYPMQETTGAVATDLSGHGNNGAYSGSFDLAQLLS